MWFMIAVILMWIWKWLKLINQSASRPKTSHCMKKQYDNVCVHRAITRKEGVIRKGIFNKSLMWELGFGSFPSCCCLAPCDCDAGHVRETNPLATTKPAAAPRGTTAPSLTPPNLPGPPPGEPLSCLPAPDVWNFAFDDNAVKGGLGFRNQAWIIVVNF